MKELTYPVEWAATEPRVTGARRAYVAKRNNHTLRIERLDGHRWQWSLITAEGNNVSDVVDLGSLAMSAHGYISAIAEAASDTLSWVSGMMTMSTRTLYHVTRSDNIHQIQTGGFADGDAHDGMPGGVWFADAPVWDGMKFEPGDAPPDWSVVTLVIPEILIGDHEVVPAEGDREYREWCLPSSLANAFLPNLRRRT